MSFICSGAKKKSLKINKPSQNADTVLLQESWLLDVGFKNADSMYSDFSVFPISSVNLGELLMG